ncbi:MAG: AsmA family protein [Flavobacteriales bacterium]|nr:AsmA family protein [Flavobacteriales bacterium]
MKKFLKILGITLLVLILLIIALPFMFKGKIIEMVKEETNSMLNAKVDFGEFDMGLLSTFPNFNFSINDVKVEGVDQFEGISLAEVKNLYLKVDLMSVISGDEIDIKSIQITEPQIRAIVLADTTANWDIMKETGEEEEAAPEEESAPFKLSLKDVTIIDGYVLYKDATMDLSTEIIGLNFNLNGDMTADMTNLNTHTTIDAFNLDMEGMSYMKKAVIVADADIEADLANSKYTFKENEVKINELILGMNGWLAMPADDIDMDLTFSAKQTEFKNILSMVPAVYLTDFSSVKTAGKLALDGYAKGTYNETKLPGFGVNLQIKDAMFKYPDLPKSANNIQVDLKVDNPDGDLDKTVVDMKVFHVELAGNPIDAHLHVTTPISDANVKAGLTANFNLASLKDVIPAEGNDELNGQVHSDLSIAGRVSAIEQERYEEFNAEGSFGLSEMLYKSDSLPYDVYIKAFTLNFSPQHVELAEFDSKIGKSDINANGRIDNIISYVFSDVEELTGTFNVNSTLLDLNEFMSDEEAASTTTTETTDEEPLSVIEIPKNIFFTLNSKFDKVVYDNMDIDQINGQLVIKDQKVSMNNLSMNLLKGSMVMSGYYETTNPEKPGINYDMNIKNFDIETVVSTFDVVQEMAPMAKHAKGTFNTSLKLDGTLDKEMMPDLMSLTGNGSMQTHSVKVEGFKAMDKLADVLKNDKLRALHVNDTKVNYEFKDGRVFVEPFDVKMGKTSGTISGSNGFDQSLDYVMKLKVPSSEIGAGEAMNKLNQQAAGIGMNLKAAEYVDVDVTITGTATDPKVGVNLKDVAGNLVEDVKEQIKEQVEEKIDEAKDKALEEARKQADKLRAEAKNQADKVRAEGKKAADDIRAKAEDEAAKLESKGGNFLEKKANQVAAKKLREEADKKAQKVEDEANKKADGIEAKADEQANKLISDAEAKLNK